MELGIFQNNEERICNKKGTILRTENSFVSKINVYLVKFLKSKVGEGSIAYYISTFEIIIKFTPEYVS